MFHFLDSYLKPYGGWQTKEIYYQVISNPHNDYEIFFPLQKPILDGAWEDHEHMLYSACENPNNEYTSEEDCPEVLIPDNIFDMLNDSFSEKVWIPYFFEWFEKNSGLPVVRIRKFDGD